MRSGGPKRVAFWYGRADLERLPDTLLGMYVDLLSRASGIPYEVLPLVDTQPNRRLPNGSWSGIIGTAQRGEADLVLGRFLMTEDQMQDFDFLFPYRRKKVTFATRRPERLAESFAAFTPFTVPVWATLVAFVALVGVCFYLQSGWRYGLGDMLFNAYAPVAAQGMPMDTCQLRDRVLLGAWVLGTAFLVHCYASVLLSFMTCPTLRGVRDIAELARAVQDGWYQCAVGRGSSLGSLLRSSDREADKALGEYLHQGRGPTGRVDMLLEHRDQNIAYLSLRGDLEFLDPALFVSQDSFRTFLVAHVVRKGFVRRRDLDRATLRVLETGLAERKERRGRFVTYFRLVSRVPGGGSEGRALTLHEVLGTLVVLVGGLAVASVALVLEVVWKKMSVVNLV